MSFINKGMTLKSILFFGYSFKDYSERFRVKVISVEVIIEMPKLD